ncbi:MAG TPA: DUF1254 domain-containing protein [Hyphomicrobiaceae bacterium]|jgi:hypothetical protein|nr:DUF1254 domain-containing protein [Hyphomicrobiaceae bacterium]
MRRRWIAGVSVSAALWTLAVLPAPSSLAQTGAGTAPGVSPQEAREIARDAYIFAYPMVLTEITRRVMTNVERPEGLHSPMNQIAHARTLTNASFTDTVRPSADALHSLMFLDVSKEPMVLSVPDSGGRYYLLPLLDMWTDVFASRGKRSSGTAAQTFAVVGPHWQGRLPNGIGAVRSPTALVVLVGRTQVGGKADFAAVHKFQNGIKAVPLRHYGKPYTPPRGRHNPQQDMSAPPDQVERMDAATFFALFAELMKENPPHPTDYPILARLKRIGIEPGKAFAPAAAPREVQRALEAAAPDALKLIKAAFARSGVSSNGWRTHLAAVGTYGADYLQRAGLAYGGLGGNVATDAVHPTAVAGADGQQLSSDRSYVLHFAKDQLPPARAFWSLTVYNDRQLLAANPIDRYALGDRDKLQFNDDGTLDIYIQRESPGADKESNWLPAPASGPFTVTMRLYWPKPEVLDGKWSPPPVRPQEPEGVVGRALR